MVFDINFILFFFVVVGISLAYTIDDLAVLSKGFGGLYKSNAIAANLGSIIYLFNRVFISLTLPALGFLVDSGVDLKNLLLAFSISSFLMVFLKFLTFQNSLKVIFLIKRIATIIYKNESHHITKKITVKIDSPRSIGIKPIIAMIMFIASMTIPSLMAVVFFDNRAFFIQLGFAFNMIGSILTILFIERNIALKAEQVVENKISDADFISSVTSIILSRAVGAFIYGLIMLAVYFII